MSRYAALNLAKFLPLWIFVGLTLVSAIMIFAIWLSARRREAQRTRTRYEFDGIHGYNEIPPRKPHSLCLWWVCFQPERGPCEHR